MKPKKVLVTGSEGFIGSHLFERLANGGFLVAGADIKNGIDIRTYKFSEKYDAIFHVAAQSSGPKSFDYPEESHSLNVLGTLRILEYAKATGAKVIFSSSSSIYGETEILPTPEDSEHRPMSPYAFQKLICEEYLKFYWLSGVRSCALRYFGVFGERQELSSGDYNLMLPTFLNQYKNNEPFTIVGTGEQRRDFVYVGDVVEANLKALDFLETADKFEIFNVGTGKNYSVLEVADMISENHPKVYLPPRSEPFATLAHLDKAKTVLKWEPKVVLEEWLNKICQRYYI